jgi:hypothetical protein
LRLGTLVAIGFALFKVVQSRRSSSARMPSGDIGATPKRSETPLVDPTMLSKSQLRRAGEAVASPDGEDAAATDTGAPAATTGTVTAGATAVQERPPAKASRSSRPSPARAWVEPQGTFCPSSHPIKAKLASGIFHLPGMTAYERTTPDRCYLDADAAEADGLRKAKR